MNLLYSGNDLMFDGILSSLLSIAKRSEDPVSALILTGDFSELKPKFRPFTQEMGEFIERAINRYSPDSKVRVYEFEGELREEVLRGTNSNGRFSPYTLLRLFADRLDGLPERILYLDADTLAIKDIKPLYEYDLGDCYLGMVRDAVGSIWLHPDYCNAGVILMDYAKVSKTNLLELCREMVAERKMFMPDQTAINTYFQGKIAFMPLGYNDQKRVHEDTVVRHYCDVMRLLPILHVDKVKQWDVERVHSVLRDHSSDDILDEYLLLKQAFLDKKDPASIR